MNFAPRVGIGYDVTGDRRTMVRGGEGLYLADIQANQVINQSVFNREKSIQASVNKTLTTNIGLVDAFGGIIGKSCVSGKVPAPTQNIQVLDTFACTPFSFQSLFGYEHQFK